MWSAYLARMEVEGWRIRAWVEVWGRKGAQYATPLLGADGARLCIGDVPRTPAEWDAIRAEAGRAAAERAAAKAAKEAKRADAERDRAGRAAHRARSDERKAAGLCVDCGGAIERQAGVRGRPSIRCASCRASAAES